MVHDGNVFLVTNINSAANVLCVLHDLSNSVGHLFIFQQSVFVIDYSPSIWLLPNSNTLWRYEESRNYDSWFTTLL